MNFANRFPNFRQHDRMDCGPTSLRIISKFYGRSFNASFLKDLIETNRLGSDLASISEAAEKIGFRTIGVKIDFNKLKEEAPLPCIVHWNENHFIVVYKISSKKVFVSDPAFGLISYSQDEFKRKWFKDETSGIALLIEPTPKFYQIEYEVRDDKKYGFKYLFKYLKKSKFFIFQLLIGLVVSSIIQVAFPFLTQSIVDVGIDNQDINFIYLLLLAQLMLFLGKISIDTIRSWIILHLSTRINVSTISDFFIKLMGLPISYFDKKMTGDIIQRIGDHKRLEKLITSSSLNTIFSSFTLVIFGFILAYYNLIIFGIFLTGITLYFTWVSIFLSKRKELDYKQFAEFSQEQSKVIELINGMQEIKLHNAERKMRWGWEFIQIRLFKVAVRRLSLEQTQTIGSSFINESKNIFITVIAAQQVIEGNMTLRMMLAVSYIIGQLNSPVVQLVDFLYSLQDAKISIERLGEIHSQRGEENLDDLKITTVSADADIKLEKLSFSYSGSKEKVLNNLELIIPSQKVTAIVGVSGSGKTTLMKLLLGFYMPDVGKISIGHVNLQNISPSSWRNECAVVMQEGYIFNCSFEENIALGDEWIDRSRVARAATIANISEFIESRALGYKTKIGSDGIGLSTGQKQRILLARAVYKNPKYFFLDEATSSLDANNEKIIMNNLEEFFKERTTVVIAHRLSTVRNADQIVVMDNGRINEIGSHFNLIAKEGAYFNLVKNQLELDRIKEVEKNVSLI